MGKATGPNYKVAFRRRRLNLTNYKRRLALIKGGLPRMVVRKSAKGIVVQFIEFSPSGDKVLSCAQSRELSSFGWVPHCNSPTAYLVGLLAAKRAKKVGVSGFNLDIGMQTPSKGSVVFAALQGAIDAGLATNYQKKMIEEGRIRGEAIASYAQQLKSSNPAKYSQIFSVYLKNNLPPENIVNVFEAVKQKIQSS
ncbi:MAG: 50S ribosomal protein L18 [Candidatus Micrarchaeota archaeon]|nr:50S ribosomal protein L18 [Candidatus Micrarchaeota archaeon]